MLKDLDHVKRLLIIATVIIAAFLLFRFIFVPKSFYEFGYYRGDSVREIMKQPPGHAGSAACAACHEDKHKEWSAGAHRPLNCETCHGALVPHTEDPTSIKPQKPRSRNHCLLCHAKNISRPGYFPQIDPAEHNKGVNCAECHNPHSPKL